MDDRSVVKRLSASTSADLRSNRVDSADNNSLTVKTFSADAAAERKLVLRKVGFSGVSPDV